MQHLFDIARFPWDMGSRHEQTAHRKAYTPLEALSEFGCLTDAQLAQVTGNKSAAIRKQMTAYATADKVQRIPRRKSGPGRPSAVSCLPDSAWVQSPTREHQIQLNDVRIAFAQSASLATGVRVSTWDTQRVSLASEHPAQSSNDDVRPDAIVLLEHEKAAQPLLVFIELDRGTEAINRTSTRQTSWAKKAAQYQQANALKRWRDWALQTTSIQQDAACRLAVVTTTPARLAQIDDTLQQIAPCVGVWLTQYTEVVAQGVWNTIWQRGGEQAKRQFLGRR